MSEKLRAFIIEDSPTVLENLGGLLEDLELVEVVGTAAAQAEACAWMDGRTNGCDVAIIDMFLASGSGLDVLEHMRSYERPPERVVLTNYATSEMRLRCKELGAEAVFDKSTEFQELVAWLAQRDRHCCSR